jgi:hypothetical protein
MLQDPLPGDVLVAVLWLVNMVAADIAVTWVIYKALQRCSAATRED